MIKKDRRGFALVFPNYCALSVDEIRKIFSRFGPVCNVNLTGDECGYRFVRYGKFEDAKSAIEGLRFHPEINLCTHGPRRKIDGNNNNSDKGNLNVTRNDDESVVVSDGSEDWEDSASQQSARSSRYAGSSGRLRETAAAAPQRNADERSATRHWYVPNVWEKDKTPAGRSPGQSDTNWRATRDNSRSGHSEANSARNSSRGANNQGGTWTGATVKTEDCPGVWDSAVSSMNQSSKRSKIGKNDDCGSVWDSAVPWNNNNSTERSKNVRNGDRNRLGGSNRKLKCQSEVNWKTSRRNVKDESVSKSTNNIWNSIKNEQSVQQKSASNETVRICNSDNDDKTNKSTEQKLSPKREINLHSRLLKIQSLNNQRNAQASKINADIDIDDECIPDLVQRKGQVSEKSQEVVIRSAKEVIVGNIPEHVTPAYILYLLEAYEPIAISHFYSAPKTCLRYCHVYFKKDKDALDAELQYDNYQLAGKRLIVSRPNRLTVLAAED